LSKIAKQRIKNQNIQENTDTDIEEENKKKDFEEDLE